MERYLELIDEYKDEMVRTLQELISIRSVAGEPEGDSPFGKGVQQAFDYMLNKGKEEGFGVENVDNYGGHIEFGGFDLDENFNVVGANDEVLGILAHLDIVPEGKDWDYPPFGGEIVDGKIYGRGTADDKGPAVAAFYAMKALKDAGVMPRKKIRLILGLDEEDEWKGMDYYLKKVKAPDMAFTPDGEFPAIHGEMGILTFDLAKKIGKSRGKGIVLRTLKGGNASNMVADHARAVLRADSYQEIKQKLEEFKEETGYAISAKGVGKSLEILVKGISSHGARPWKGLNAVSIMFQFLERIGVENEEMQDWIHFYNQHIGFNLHGEGIGCDFSDDISGRLIFNVGMVDLDDEAVTLTANIRYPVTMNDEQVYEAMMPILNQYDIGIIKHKHQEPIYFPADDPMIVTLMDVYRKHTGDQESKPLVIGGGTYARAMKNAVAFGAVFPGEPELAHQKNEYIKIDSMVKAAKIFADTIYALAEGTDTKRS